MTAVRSTLNDKSMSRHRRPSSSPRRSPVCTANKYRVGTAPPFLQATARSLIGLEKVETLTVLPSSAEGFDLRSRIFTQVPILDRVFQDELQYTQGVVYCGGGKSDGLAVPTPSRGGVALVGEVSLDLVAGDSSQSYLSKEGRQMSDRILIALQGLLIHTGCNATEPIVCTLGKAYRPR